MTLPDERTNAVRTLRAQVLALAPLAHGKSETVRVPRETIKHLVWCLKHYPNDYDLTLSAARCPETWGPPEPTVDGRPM